MKNALIAKVMKNTVINRTVGEIGKFYISHESAILTTGTISFGLAALWVTAKNATDIHYILEDAKIALNECNTKEERNDVYALTIRSLFPKIAPILIFEGASVGCALFAKKQSDKKLAEAAGALTIAQAAIAQYQSFQKDAEQALGEEKYAKLQDDIYKNIEVDGRRFNTLPTEGAPGELLFIDKYSGRPFWCHESRIEFATNQLSAMLTQDNGSYDGVVSLNDWYDEIQNPDLKRTELGDRFGYLAKVEKNGISYRLSDTHYIFPNGTRVQAAELYLYPEPDYIG